jgi:signal transduction histidine kinase
MRHKVILGLIAAVSVAWAFSVAEAEEMVTNKAAEAQVAAEVKSLVETASATFVEKGPDYTLKLINSIHGPFFKKSTYVLAGSLNADVLAHPALKSLIGKNLMELKGAKGELFVKEFVRVATGPGTGWVEYWWIKTGEKDPTLKKTYVMRVPGHDIFLAAGYYLKEDSVSSEGGKTAR